MTQRGEELRVLIFAGHFAEIGLRFGAALSNYAGVHLLVDERNLHGEWGDAPLPQRRSFSVATMKGKGVRHTAPALIWALLHHRPHVVQFEETTSPWLKLLVRIARPFAAVALRVHDVETHEGRDSLLSPRVLSSRDWTRRSVDLVLVHGPSCRREFVQRYATPVLETVHGGIMLPTSGQQRKPEANCLLMFGRMEAYKGLDVLYEALCILAREGVMLPTLIAGRGPELERLSAKLAALPGVEILDAYLSPKAAAALFRRSEIVVLPYRDASQSGVAAAGLGNGCILVASAVGGLPDIVVDGVTGLLVPPGDSRALADALRRLGRDPELRARLRAGATQFAQDHLGWSGIAATAAERFSKLKLSRRWRVARKVGHP